VVLVPFRVSELEGDGGHGGFEAERFDRALPFFQIVGSCPAGAAALAATVAMALEGDGGFFLRQEVCGHGAIGGFFLRQEVCGHGAIGGF